MTTKKSFSARAVSAAFGIALSCFAYSAKADTYATYTVDATYDTTGTVTGSFTIDTTNNTSAMVDLTIVGVGGVNSGVYTDPTLFAPGTYNTAAGEMDTYNTENPTLQVFLTYPAGGGSLYNSGFGSSSVDSFFSPTCAGIECGYSLTGSVTSGGAISATPEPSAWALMIVGLGGIGFLFRRGRRLAPVGLGGDIAA